MPAPRNESPIESIVSNPGRTSVKCAWGTADGSWLNQNNRWLEGDPNLVTGYALLSLAYCRP